MHHDTPTIRLMDAALIAAPALYLLTDILYAARGWDDGNAAALNMVAAAVYGLAVARLVLFATGRLQAVMTVIAAIGVPASFGVAVNTLHVHYGHTDLFDLDGPANLFKTLGFFFPLTLLLAALAVRTLTPFWVSTALVIGAVLFPVAHVTNNAPLAIIDGAILLAALTGLRQTTHPDGVSTRL